MRFVDRGLTRRLVVVRSLTSNANVSPASISTMSCTKQHPDRVPFVSVSVRRVLG